MPVFFNPVPGGTLSFMVLDVSLPGQMWFKGISHEQASTELEESGVLGECLKKTSNTCRIRVTEDLDSRTLYYSLKVVCYKLKPRNFLYSIQIKVFKFKHNIHNCLFKYILLYVKYSMCSLCNIQSDSKNSPPWNIYENKVLILHYYIVV